jgi:hypothetical protein
MKHAIAHFFSIVFHPIFTNLLGMYLLFLLFPSVHFSLPSKAKWFYLLFIYSCTHIIPLIMSVVLKQIGKISSLQMQDRKERTLPFAITLFMYAFCYYNFSNYPIPQKLLNYLIASGLLMLIILSINFFYKISIHAASIGATIGLVFLASFESMIDLRYLLAALVIVAGLVISSRLQLNAHNQKELSSGFFIGLFTMVIFL